MAKTRIRTSELWLTAIACLVALCGSWLVALHNADTVTLAWPDVRSAALLCALFLSVPMIWSIVRFRADQLLYPCVALLAALGFVTMLRLSPDLEAIGRGAANADQRQLLYIAGGTFLTLVIARYFDYWHLLRRYRYTILVGCICLLLATFVFGTPIYGARLWITVGPIQIQPSEVVKIGLVLFLAAYLDERQELVGSNWRVGPLNLPPIPYLLPMIVMWSISLIVLVVENDLGSALLLFGIFLTMIYAGTGRALYVSVGLVSFALACWAALAMFDRVGIRVQNWLDPWRDPLDTGYQQIQSDYAIASGGIMGVGLGRGEPWLIPAVETDFVISAIAEELGMLGTLSILTLFGVIVLRGFSIGLRQRDDYFRLVAIGLSVSVGIQTAVILGGVFRLIPLTGITLPFVSYGGSSMLTNFTIVGLLLNLSARTREAR